MVAEITAGKQRGGPSRRGPAIRWTPARLAQCHNTGAGSSSGWAGESLTQKAIDLALGGDMAALRLCLDRILPPRKDRP